MTWTSIVAAFLDAAESSADYLVFYFSGHANDVEFGVHGGGVEYADLAFLIQTLEASHVFVILDVCSAASAATFFREARIGGVGGIRESWLAALANATPGTRLIFSTGAGQTARESTEFGNGIFTHHFLDALKRGYGDLAHGSTEFISDLGACEMALHTMTEAGVKQQPVCINLTGDFPMTISQAEEPVGWATFNRVKIAPQSLDVRCKAFRRMGVTTHLRWSVFNAANKLIATDTIKAVADKSVQGFYADIPCPRGEIRRDPHSRAHLMTRGQAPITWLLELLDDTDNVLASTETCAIYRSPALRLVR